MLNYHKRAYVYVLKKIKPLTYFIAKFTNIKWSKLKFLFAHKLGSKTSTVIGLGPCTAAANTGQKKILWTYPEHTRPDHTVAKSVFGLSCGWWWLESHPRRQCTMAINPVPSCVCVRAWASTLAPKFSTMRRTPRGFWSRPPLSGSVLQFLTMLRSRFMAGWWLGAGRWKFWSNFSCGGVHRELKCRNGCWLSREGSVEGCWWLRFVG